MEGRSARTNRFVTRIDRNAIVGSFPRERQVRTVIVHAGDLPYELVTLEDRRVLTVVDDAIVTCYQAIVRVSHDELVRRDTSGIVARRAIGRFRSRRQREVNRTVGQRWRGVGVRLEVLSPAFHRTVAREASSAERH